jgi:hypothetical protein
MLTFSEGGVILLNKDKKTILNEEKKTQEAILK